MIDVSGAVFAVNLQYSQSHENANTYEVGCRMPPMHMLHDWQHNFILMRINEFDLNIKLYANRAVYLSQFPAGGRYTGQWLNSCNSAYFPTHYPTMDEQMIAYYGHHSCHSNQLLLDITVHTYMHTVYGKNHFSCVARHFYVPAEMGRKCRRIKWRQMQLIFSCWFFIIFY